MYFRDMVRGVIPNQETHERGPTLFSNFGPPGTGRVSPRLQAVLSVNALPLPGAGRQVAWRIRLACSPIEAWGAWQRSRFGLRAPRDARCREIFLNVGLWSADATKNTKTYFVW